MVQRDRTMGAALSWGIQASFRNRVCCLCDVIKLQLDKPGQHLVIKMSLDNISSLLAVWVLKKALQTHCPAVPCPDYPGALSYHGLSVRDEQLQICPGHRRVTTNLL